MPLPIKTKEDGLVTGRAGKCRCGTRVRRNTNTGTAYELVGRDNGTVGWERHDCPGVQLTIGEVNASGE